MTVSRIGLIGDVHAEDERLLLAINTLKALDAEILICTGDIVDGKGCPNLSIELLKQHDVVTVRGNHDRWILQDKARHVADAHNLDDLHDHAIEYLESLPLQYEIETVDGRVLLCHGIGENDLKKVWPGTERMEIERSSQLDDIIESGRFNYVINGHMHFRTMIHFDALTLINAGTLRGEHWPGFSLLDLAERHIEAYEFADGSVRPCMTKPISEPSHVVFGSTRDFSGNWDPVRLF